MPMGLKTQGFVKIETLAKVTLRLEVGSRLPDGYHQVRIALVPVSLRDSLHLKVEEGEGVLLEVEGESGEDVDLGPAEDNLAVRAARSFLAELGRPLRIHLRLIKRIPAGAGLGGGSGNAAGVLVGLNRWMGAPLSSQALERLATGLGMDVPFFLAARPSWAEGRGERLRPLDVIPGLALLVACPDFAISTARAYELVTPGVVVPDDVVPNNVAPNGVVPNGVVSNGVVLNSLATREDPPMGTVEDVAAALANHFEAALFPRYPELAEVRERLLDAGALGACLSGSGSALFGLFPHDQARDEAATAMAAEAEARRWRLYPCTTLPGHDYEPLD